VSVHTDLSDAQSPLAIHSNRADPPSYRAESTNDPIVGAKKSRGEVSFRKKTMARKKNKNAVFWSGPAVEIGGNAHIYTVKNHNEDILAGPLSFQHQKEQLWWKDSRPSL